MILRHATDYDKKLAKEIYYEAFPKSERKPWHLVLKWVNEGRYDLLIARDDNGVAGLLITIPYKDVVLYDYLAVNPKNRNKGYGTKILDLADKHYEGMRLVLVAEIEDENAENNNQRQARMRFYKKNGWTKTNYASDSVGGKFQILTKGEITPDEYIAVYKYGMGGFLYKLSKLKVTLLDN